MANFVFLDHEKEVDREIRKQIILFLQGERSFEEKKYILDQIEEMDPIDGFLNLYKGLLLINTITKENFEQDLNDILSKFSSECPDKVNLKEFKKYFSDIKLLGTNFKPNLNEQILEKQESEEISLKQIEWTETLMKLCALFEILESAGYISENSFKYLGSIAEKHIKIKQPKTEKMGKINRMSLTNHKNEEYQNRRSEYLREVVSKFNETVDVMLN